MYLKKVPNFLNYYYYFFIFQLDPCIGRDGEVSRYNLNYNLDFRTSLFPGSLSLATGLDFRKVCGMSSKILHFPCHHHHHHQLNYGWTSQPGNLWSPPHKPPAILNTKSFPLKDIHLDLFKTTTSLSDRDHLLVAFTTFRILIVFNLL